MVCRVCKNDIPSSASFCPNCGTSTAVVPVAAYQTAHLRTLQQQQQYAAILANDAVANDAAFAELRDEAQKLFDESLDVMVRLAAPYTQRELGDLGTKRLATAFRKETAAGAALSDPVELEAYAHALIQRAKDLAATSAPVSQILGPLYCIVVLGSTTYGDDAQAWIDQLWADSAARADTAAEARQPILLPSTADAPEPSLAVPDIPNSGLTDTTDPSGLISSTDVPAAELKAIDALSALEQGLRLDSAPAAISARLAAAQAIVHGGSPYLKRLENAALRAEALLNELPKLRAILAQPLADWLAEGAFDDLERTSGALFDTLDRVFESDALVSEPLRQERQRRLGDARRVRTQVASLPALSDAALIETLAELERELPTELSLLAAAQVRRAAYVEQQQRLREEADTAEQSRLLREGYLADRRKLDTLYSAPDPKDQELLDARNAAEAASNSSLLQPADNPLDVEAVEYYNLLIADLYRRVTAPTAKALEARTLAQSNDLLRAYRGYQDALVEAQGTDDPRVSVTIKRDLEIARGKLFQFLAQQTAETLNRVEQLLQRDDYRAALQELEAARENYAQAELDLPPEFSNNIKKWEQEARSKAERDDQSQALRLDAEKALVSAGDTAPDFLRAFENLDKAAGFAPWRKTEIDRQRDQLELSRRQFVSARIERARFARQSGEAENLAEADRLLNEAEANTNANDLRDQISQLRAALLQQQQNQRKLQSIRETARQLAEQAESGMALDEIVARVAAERARIGTKDNPNLDDETWIQVDRLLGFAEQRVGAWQRFRELRNRAEQAAADGDSKAVQSHFTEINLVLSDQIYLPISAERARLISQAQEGSEIARVRAMLESILDDLATNESQVSAERLDKAIRRGRMITGDSYIDRNVATLDAQYLPLYILREELTRAIEQSDFERFDHVYQQASESLRGSPQVSRLKQDADIARVRRSFDDEFQPLMRRVRPLFNNGWDQPDGFQEAVAAIKTFSEKAPAAQRSEHQRLDVGVIDQLDSLASLLASASVSAAHHRYDDAVRRISSMLGLIPTNEMMATTLLGVYTAELGYLRNVLVATQDQLKQRMGTLVEETNRFNAAMSSYLSCVRDERNAFNKNELLRVQSEFAPLAAPEHQTARDAYLTAIRAIIAVIEQVDACEELVIARPGADDPIDRGGADRKKKLDEQLASIQAKSIAIKATAEGSHWRGIQDEATYRALRANAGLARAIGHADAWLTRSRGYERMPIADLRELRADAEDLSGLELGGKSEGELRQARLDQLVEASCGRFNEVRARVARINNRLEQNRRQRGRTIGWTSFAAMLLALVGLVYLVPPARTAVAERLFGTPTPQPTATLDPAVLSATSVALTPVVVTATPEPTATLTPSPTPVPPQPGIVIFPGRINVRQNPDLALEGLTFVIAGDEVLVTGYTDDPEGRRWYRLDVTTKNLRDVWLIARAADRGQEYETVRLDSQAQLDPLLLLPYRQ